MTLVLTVPAAAGAQHRRSGGGTSQPVATAAPRSAPAPSAARAPAPSTSTGPNQPHSTSRQNEQTSSKDDTRASAPGRRRGDIAKTGDAVARSSPPRPPHESGSGGGAIIGSYPLFGYGAYYGGYYAYDPSAWTEWYGAYDSSSLADSVGALRLKVKPVEASVYVDGYFVGLVDDFDGVFQRLRLDAGPHHVDIRSPEYLTLSFDVLIQRDHTTTFRGDMKRTT
jgi:PEGA domain